MPEDLKQLAARFRRDDESSPAAEVSDVDVEAALASRLAAATADAEVTLPASEESAAEVVAVPEPDPEPISVEAEPSPKKRRKSPKRAEKPKAAEPGSPAMRKTTVLVPSGLLASVRAWTEETGRTNSDAVLTAYLNHESTVAEKFAATAEDARRIELGLPTLAVAGNSSSTSDEPKVQLGLYIRATALDELSTAAEQVSLSRSEYVAELLAAEFSGHPQK